MYSISLYETGQRDLLQDARRHVHRLDGRGQLSTSIQFECLKTGCVKRYPLEICNSTEELHPCGAHNIKLNDVRDMFGKLHLYLLISKMNVVVTYWNNEYLCITCKQLIIFMNRFHTSLVKSPSKSASRLY